MRDGPSSDFPGLVGYHAYELEDSATRSWIIFANISQYMLLENLWIFLKQTSEYIDLYIALEREGH